MRIQSNYAIEKGYRDLNDGIKKKILYFLILKFLTIST